MIAFCLQFCNSEKIFLNCPSSTKMCMMCGVFWDHPLMPEEDSGRRTAGAPAADGMSKKWAEIDKPNLPIA